MRITKIEIQKKNRSRKSVFIDGRFQFGIGGDVLDRCRLHEGCDVSQLEIDNLIRIDEADLAKKAALRFLRIRPRSVREMNDYLRKKKFSDTAAETTVEELLSARLLDDREFASMLCRDRSNIKPVGSSMIKQLLLRKGISRDIVEEELSRLYKNSSELDIVMLLAIKRLTVIEKLHTSKNTASISKRLSDYLLRRGFDVEVIKTVVHQLTKENYG